MVFSLTMRLDRSSDTMEEDGEDPISSRFLDEEEDSNDGEMSSSQE